MIHLLIRAVLYIALAGCLSSAIYYFICLWTAAAFSQRRQLRSSPLQSASLPPVSILKPLKGMDPEIYDSFRSHCLQEYPEYEIIFGVSDPQDPAIASVDWLRRDFPKCNIRLVVCTEILGANVKVSNLEQMVRAAQYEHLVVNDSDILVDSDYLRTVIAPLHDPHVGMVTCLYRGIAAPSLGSKLEALGITDFCSSVLVAEQLERGLHFGLGSTLAFRRAELNRIGGFKSMVDFLADDYELGRRIAGLGRKILLSETVVETHLPAYDMGHFLRHQLRWARGVRDARRSGYIGLVSTFGIAWALTAVLAAAASPWSWLVLAGILLLRTVLGFFVCRSVLQDEEGVERLWLLPLRDLIAVGVWIASFTGHTVTWRGDKFQLKNGRLIRI
ncbi:MAG TPA: bacteriohopanetetrol glucosamine biosynthesis glycosyltransferase HpnI [Candidatus Sulfotelmatobacter sp.]